MMDTVDLTPRPSSSVESRFRRRGVSDVQRGKGDWRRRASRADVIQPHRFLEDGKEIHLAIAHRLLSLGHRIGEVPAVLSWPERDGARIRSKRTNWLTIRRLVASHLAF